MAFETSEVDLQSFGGIAGRGNFVSLIDKFRFMVNLRSLSTLMPFETSEVDLQSFDGIAGRETLSV